MKFLSNLLLILLFSFAFYLTGCESKSSTQHEPEAKTTSGMVSGSFSDGVNAFKRIPYARSERFMPQQDPQGWDGVLETREFGTGQSKWWNGFRSPP